MNAQRVVVLMYHRIGEAHNAWERKYCVSPAGFAAQMHALARRGMKAAPIEHFIAWSEGKEHLPDGSFLLTFDDGFHGVYEYALPVLKALDWPATIFLVSSLIGSQDEWCRNENPSNQTYPLLGLSEIEAMIAAGFSFHSHTRHHKRLPTLRDAELEEQLVGSRQELANLLGTPIDYLAYPYGLHDARVVEAARVAGYKAAFSTQPGFNRPDQDRYRLRRLDVFGTDTVTLLLRKIKFGSNDGSLAYAARYYFDRCKSRLTGAER